MDKEKIKERIKNVIKEHKRKRVEGKPNIEGVSAPKKHKPKKVKEDGKRKHTPGQVSIGAHGGRYIQEASGHKRYVSEGQLSGVKRFKKSIQETLEDIVKKGNVQEFVAKFKGRK